ncbi:MAG: hypothetical protein LUH53_03550 [Lachnospiraceae bacterium]|nr:hypothetical protein [Lachnospiraceae bacterium]
MLEHFFATMAYIINGIEMGYNSVFFLGGVLIFLGVLYLLRGRARTVWILLMNLIFYVWAGGRAGLAVILATCVIVYMTGRRMETIYAGFETEKKGLTPKEQMGLLNCYKKRTRRYLWLALFLIFGAWAAVKAGKLCIGQTTDSFREMIAGKGIIVPLGISYYTLSSAGYLLDVYWRKTKPEHNFLDLFTVMTYFPHIVQGPIGKYNRLTGQLKNLPKFDYERVCFGLQLMLWGYIKKLVIADRLALFTSTVFAEPSNFAGTEIFLAVVLCAIELYADFSGCMDIVGGISQAIGIELDVNFRQPFFAKSAAEFWRRWHITLGTWAKDYIYMPIAISPTYMQWTWKLKKSTESFFSSLLKELLPLLLVWLFTGLWHGTGYGYIVWGLYWFALILLSHAVKPLTDRFLKQFAIQTDRPLYRACQSIRTFFLFVIGRMFTVAGGLQGCWLLWKQLFAESRIWTLFDGSLYKHGVDRKYFYVVLIGMILMFCVDFWHEKGIRIRKTIAGLPLPLRWALYLTAMFTIVIFGVYGIGYDAASFIYGAF